MQLRHQPVDDDRHRDRGEHERAQDGRETAQPVAEHEVEGSERREDAEPDHQGELVLGLFDTGTPEKFDSVVIDNTGRIQRIDVKVADPSTKWTWAIGRMSVRVARSLKPNALFGASLHEYCQSQPGYALELAQSSCLDIGILDDYTRAESFVKMHEK